MADNQANSSCSDQQNNEYVNPYAAEDALLKAHDQGDLIFTESSFEIMAERLLQFQNKSKDNQNSKIFSQSAPQSEQRYPNSLNKDSSNVLQLFVQSEPPPMTQKEQTNYQQFFLNNVGNEVQIDESMKAKYENDGSKSTHLANNQQANHTKTPDAHQITTQTHHQQIISLDEKKIFKKTLWRLFKAQDNTPLHNPNSDALENNLQMAKQCQNEKQLTLSEASNNTNNSFTNSLSTNQSSIPPNTPDIPIPSINPSLDSVGKKQSNELQEQQILKEDAHVGSILKYLNQELQFRDIHMYEQINEEMIQRIKDQTQQQILTQSISDSRGKLSMMSLTEFAKKDFKNQKLLRAFAEQQNNTETVFIANLNSVRKDQDSFYRAIIVSYLSQLYASNNRQLQKSFPFDKVLLKTFKELTVSSKGFSSANIEILVKCFSQKCRMLIEKSVNANSKIVSSEIANEVLQLISQDDEFDSACILIARNLSLDAFQMIKNNPLYSPYLDDEGKSSVEKEFLQGDKEPSELAKVAIAQAFNVKIKQQNMFNNVNTQKINKELLQYLPVVTDKNSLLITCTVINHQAHYNPVFSQRFA